MPRARPAPAPILAALRDLVGWLRHTGVPAVVVGGVSVSFLARPRMTQDIDVLADLEEAKWADFARSGKGYGFTPRVRDALSFARRSRVLLVRHRPTRVPADLVFAGLLLEREIVARRSWVRAGRVRIPVPTPEDLVIMKAVSHRPRDLADIDAVLETTPKLNRRRVLRVVRQFSTALAQPDLLADLKCLLHRHRRAK